MSEKSFFVKFQIYTIVFLFSFNCLIAQNTDTLKIKKHSPQKATLMSACLPGLGQYYNKKYWKIPVIYIGAGVITYFAISNSDSLKVYKNAYSQRVNGGLPLDAYHDRYSDDDLLKLKDFYRRNLELTFMVAAGIYVFNIIDATVDAHLFNFDINEDISMKLNPIFVPFERNSFTGINLTFKFK